MAGHGFVYPAIGLAKELVRRGHEVLFVTGKDYKEILRRNGLARHPNGRQDSDSFRLARWTWPRETARQVRHIGSAVEAFQPDVLVGSMLGQGAPVASEIHGLPIAILGLAMYPWALPSMGRAPSHTWGPAERRAVNMVRGDAAEYERLRTMLNVPASRSRRAAPWLGDLFLLQSVPELQPDPDSLPPQVHFVGSCTWEEEGRDEARASWLRRISDEDRKLIYAQPGAYFEGTNFWPHLVDALQHRHIAVAASVGRSIGMDEASSVDRYPEHFFVREHVPQGSVLPYATGVVTKGNSTAVLGALTHGLPQLLVPGGGEQWQCAAMCVEAGVCVGLNEANVTVKSISEAVDRVLEDTKLRSAAKVVQGHFRKVSGPLLAASLLEALAGSGQPVHRTAPEAVDDHSPAPSKTQEDGTSIPA